MDDLIQLSAPWWHFVVRALLVYVGLLLLIRLSGKRTVGEFTPFDLVVVLLLAEAMQGAMTAGDTSLSGAMILAVTLIALNYAVGALSARSKLVDRLTEGESVTLVRDGKVLRDALLRNNVPKSDIEEAAREQGVASLRKVELATLEANGHITIVPKRVAKA